MTRRGFLKNSAIVGAATLPNWLGGCCPPWLEQCVDTPLPEGRELRTLHFDLSHVDPEKEYILHVVRSQSHKIKLVRHTDETRSRHRAENTLLQQIPDKQLTHFVVDVDFPANALQHWWVLAENANGPAAVVTTHIHVPWQASKNLAERKQRKVLDGLADRVIDESTHAKLKYLGITRLRQRSDEDVLGELNSINTPIDAAVSLVFHHPEIMNLNPDQAANVLDVIHNLQGDGTSCTGDNVGMLTALACAISAQGPATTDGGWMQLVPATDHNGEPVLDSDGNPIYDYRPSEATLQATQPVVAEVLRQIFNDPDIKGRRFADHPGATTSDDDGTSRSVEKNASSVSYNLTQYGGAIGSHIHGLIFKKFSISDPATRQVSMELQNIYLRFLTAYVLYLAADGTPILGDDGKPVSPEKLAVIPTNDAIMGIPLMDDVTLQKTKLSFQMPASASYASILFGTMGVGSMRVSYDYGPGRFDLDASDLTHAAMAWTLVINIGIPTLLLAIGVGLESSGLLKSVTSDSEILLAIAAIVVPIFIAGEATRGCVQGSARGPIVDTANVLIAICIKCIPKLAAKIFGYASAKEAEQAIPIIGWAVKILSVIGGISQLAQTTGEILSSPPIIRNDVSVTMNTTITVQHDPMDFEFPATARKYVIRATYDGTLVRESCGDLPTTRSDPIVVTFRDIPVGGTVQIDAWFLSDDNWVAGYAGTGHWVDTGEIDDDGQPVEKWIPESYPNFPDQASAVLLTVKENLVPLTATTTYHHREKIDYQNGVHVWVAAAAPTETLFHLDTTREDRLHALNGITVSQSCAAAGYSWRTGTPMISPCASDGVGATSLHMIQNLSLTERPDDALKLPNCGHVAAPLLAYDMLAPLGSRNRNFLVDPVYGPHQIDDVTSLPYKYFVRSVTMDGLTDTTPFADAGAESWGWFNQSPDGIAVHPLGHVVAVNTANSKLEILHLTGAAVPDEEAHCACMLSGFGDQVGLLRGPVAVSVSPNGAILVLDAGNLRVQAFDTFGNPANVFEDAAGTPSSVFSLVSTNASRFLDIAVERAVGFIYILYYTGGGSLVSDYVLDIYTSKGVWLTRTTGVNAARMALDYWRNVYTLNFEAIRGPGGRIEPSISQWIPSTPPGDDPNVLAALQLCGP